MVDNTKYVNSYIDIVMKMLHDNLTESIQYKTQIKILSDSVHEKDAVIASLSKELETNKTNSEEVDKIRNSASNWETQYNAMKNKASHVDTLLSQINEMKRMIQDKEEQINNITQEKDKKILELEEKIKTLTDPKINKRRKTKDASIIESVNTSILPLSLEVSLEASSNKGFNDF